MRKITLSLSCFVMVCCCLLFSVQSNAQSINFSNSTIVNVGDTVFITTVLTDANGAPEVGTPVEYTVTGTHPQTSTINTDANGEATLTYIATSSGTDNFTRDVNNGAFVNNGTITINEVVLPTVISFSGEQTVNMGDMYTSTITLTDTNGDPIPSELITYTITGANSDSGTLTTGPNGEAIISYMPTNPGTDTITLTTADGATLTYTVLVSNPTPNTIITYTGDQTVYPGNLHTSTITLTDTLGNPLPNETFTYTITGTNPSTGTLTTDANGNATLSYPTTTPGTDTITITSTDGAISSYTVTTVNPDNLFFTFIPGTATAGEPFTMTLVVTDQNGNPVPDAPVTYMVSGTNSFTGTATTNADGEAILTYTPTTQGTDSFTVTVGGSTQSININVGQGACPDCATGPVTTQACNDGDPCTVNDVETILDCDGSVCVPCQGVPADCTNAPTSVVACDDGDPCTANDVQTISDCDGSICVPCQGTLEDCASANTTVVACDDGDPCTINDVQEVACDGSICIPCQGTVTPDCTNGPTTSVACDDGDPCTINDVQEVACDGSICVPCQGILQDCTNGGTTVVACDDGDPCTINDTQEVACDGSICVPCQGTLQDCSNGGTTVVACNDGDPCTINDTQEVACDGSICVPCQGVSQGCAGPTTVVSCDDGDPCTLNDQQEIACDGSVCVPCQGENVEVSCEDNVLDFSDNGIDWTHNALSGSYTVGNMTYTITIDDSDNILYTDQYEGPFSKESGSGIRIGIDPHDVNDIVTITYNLSQTADFVSFKIRDFDLKTYGPGSSNQQEGVCVYGFKDGVATPILPVITSFDGSVDINGNCAEATANSSQSGKEESVLVEFTECVDRIVVEYGSGNNSPVSDPSYSKIYIGDEFGFVTKSCNPSCGTLSCDNAPSITQPCDDGNPLTINDVETVLACGGAVCVPCAGTPAVCDENTLDFSDHGIDWHTNALAGSYTVGSQTFGINVADADGILQDTYENYSGLTVGIEPHDVNDKVVITYDLSEVSSNVIFDIVDLDYKNSGSQQQEAVCVYGFLGNNQTQILPTITSLDGHVAIDGNCAEATTNSATSGRDESILVSFTDCIDRIVIEYGTGSNSPVADPSYSKIHIGKHLGFSAFTCENACVVDCGGGSSPGGGDADGDGVCDDVDICPGFDDNADSDGDGIPDGCETCVDYDLDFSEGGNNWVTNSTSGSYTVGEQTFDITIADNDHILHDTYESHAGIMVGIDPHDTEDELIITYNLSQVSSNVVFDIVDLDYKDGNSRQQEAVCVYGLLGNDPTEILPIITSLDGNVAIDGNCAEATTNSAVSGQDESILVEFTQCIDQIVIVYGTGSNSPTHYPSYSKIYIGEQYGIQTEVCQDVCVVDCGGGSSPGGGDADGDGVCDDVDVCPGFDDFADADGDGIPDGCETCMDYALDFAEDGNNWHDGSLSGSYTDGAQTFDISIADADGILQHTQERYSGIKLGIDPHDVNDQVVACYNLSEVSSHVIFDIVDLDKKDGSSKQQEAVCVYGLLGASQTQIMPTITSLDGSVAINGNCAEATTNSAVSGQYESILVEFTECIDKIVIEYGTGSDSPTPDPTYSKIYIGKHYGIQTEVCQDACVADCADASSPGDDDNDGVCNVDDLCPGFDDNIDLDGNGIPDGCDVSACDTPPVIGTATLTCTNGNVTIMPVVTFNSSCSGDAGAFMWAGGEQTNTLTVTTAGTYTFMVTDCDGCTSNGSVTITESDICTSLLGLQAIAVNDDNVTLQNQAVRGNVFGNDINPYNYNMTVQLVSEPTHGRLFFYPSGSYEYIPDAGYIGPDQFEYQICDADLECINATTTITVTSIIFDPIIVNNDDAVGALGVGAFLEHYNGNAGLHKNAAVTWTGNLLVNDAAVNDADLVVSTTPVTMPQHGSLTLHADGLYEYTPVEGYVGKDMFEYEVCTDAAPVACATATMYITIIEDMNGMPFGGDDFFAVEENGQINGDVTLNDYDTNGENVSYIAYNEDVLSANITSDQGADVTLNADGTFIYTAPNGYIGPDFFRYMMTDASGNTAKATVNVLVQRLEAKIDVKVFLAGALGNNIAMSTTLNDRGLLPGQTPNSNIAIPTPAGQPYNTAPWNYNGTEGAGWTDANYEAIEAQYDAEVVDWVLVNFRTEVEASTLVGRIAGILLNDGSVIFPEGTMPLANLTADALYILVEHRNHMGVMSPAAVNVSDMGELTLDLRDKDSYTTQTGLGQFEMSNGVWAMPAGDGSQTTDPTGYDINGNDKTIWVQENGTFDQYLRADYNLDGDVNGGDKVLWYDNNGTFSSVPK